LGCFPDGYADFGFMPFVLFVDDYLYVSEFFKIHVYKKPFSDQSEFKDITDEIDGTYTIAGTIEAGEEISIAITVNPPEENPLSGAAYWAPQSINGVSFEADPQNPNRYTATLTLEELGEQDIEIIWSKQIYFNRFVEWQASEYQGKTTKTTTVIIDLTPLTDLINEAQALLAGAVPGEGNGQYPQSAITALQNAIAAAAEVSHEESLTPQELNDAIDALTEAMEAFEDARIAVDNKPLSDAVQNAKGMQKGNYTDQSWSNLQKAINNAKALLNKGNYTQQEIDNALNAIASAIKALENKSKNPGTGDSANLNALVMLAIASLSAIILSNKKKLPC
jgi:tetratricopeptide (TPR) repeat protein